MMLKTAFLSLAFTGLLAAIIGSTYKHDLSQNVVGYANRRTLWMIVADEQPTPSATEATKTARRWCGALILICPKVLSFYLAAQK